ncbi:MAG: N-acetylmuramic acid 6-phosphate etherase [Elusimicrobia bacterium]|nr:N-acetylmuramic acid 6-phosphate etherase [Elusimicrobiota bacterium]
MTTRIHYAQLPTEENNFHSRHIDRVSIGRALQIVNNEDAKVARSVRARLRSIEKAVQMIVASLQQGGRLFFIGAGTSGRLGILEAAECPPTFNTPPSMVQAFMAGGRSSVFRSKEGAEDRGSEGARIVRKNVRTGDVVVGIAASGVTPFVREGLTAANAQGAKTILVMCHSTNLKSPARHVIAVKTGPEVIAGSTRLKAATATKMVLNMLTVVSMVQLGKVYGNRMVDLQPRSAKLENRATRLIMELGKVSEKRAQQLLDQSGGNAKTAIVMAKKKISKREAIRLLTKFHGRLHRAIAQ